MFSEKSDGRRKEEIREKVGEREEGGDARDKREVDRWSVVHLEFIKRDNNPVLVLDVGRVLHDSHLEILTYVEV